VRVKISDVRHNDAWAAANPAEHRLLLQYAAADPFRAEPGHVEGMARQLAARATHDTWARLPRIASPTLVMGGRFDGIATPDVVTALAQRISGAQLRFYDGGHLFMLEDRTAFSDMIAFLT
jgi:3-oxoadipate enol-lactonase